MSSIEPIIGRYLNTDIGGRPHRVYFEEAGAGIPLLCLHTAGSDGRQYRGVLNDAEITSRFRVIAFDMPWHGKSSPPDGWWEEEYKLTTASYAGMVMEFAAALGLDKPLVMGCSIGGRIVLELAAGYGEKLRGVIGLQSAAHTEGYYDLGWLHRADVHGDHAAQLVPVPRRQFQHDPPADGAAHHQRPVQPQRGGEFHHHAGIARRGQLVFFFPPPIGG